MYSYGYFVLSAILFCSGLMLMLTRRNAIVMLMGVELMLNAANLNFIAFNRLHPHNNEGQVAAVFSIIIAAGSAAVALAVILYYYDQRKSIKADEANSLKG